MDNIEDEDSICELFYLTACGIGIDLWALQRLRQQSGHQWRRSYLSIDGGRYQGNRDSDLCFPELSAVVACESMSDSSISWSQCGWEKTLDEVCHERNNQSKLYVWMNALFFCIGSCVLRGQAVICTRRWRKQKRHPQFLPMKNVDLGNSLVYQLPSLKDLSLSLYQNALLDFW